MRILLPVALAALLTGCGKADGPAADACAAVTATSLGAASATATWHPAKLLRGEPAHCEIAATLKPVPGSNIGVVYRLPDNWNGKVYGIGGGGWAGDTFMFSAREPLGHGYATMQTDAGHPVDRPYYTDWASQNPQAAKDFSDRAIHEMTVAGKKAAAAYYGRKPGKAYFVGCSTGGRMALMEAQRFPEDYDAIVAGSPVYTLQTQITGLMASNLFGAPGAAFGAGDLRLATKSAVAACDAQDGLEDGLINDPRACHWDPAMLQCSGGKMASCLVAPQVAALKTLYRGIKSPDGEWAMWPISRGGETAWGVFVGTSGEPEIEGRGLRGLKPLMFPDRDIRWTRFSATDAPQVRNSAFAAMYEAKDPDLSKFFARGGKLLVWAGESDVGPAPTGVIDYAAEVMAANPRAAEQFRLFLVPGVGHCGGSLGPDPLRVGDMIDVWAVSGKPPESTVAKAINQPVCAWPTIAHYGGSGEPNDARWRCVARSDAGNISRPGERG